MKSLAHIINLMAVRGDHWVKSIVTTPLWWEDCRSEYDYCLLVYNEESDVVNHMIGFMRGLALKTRSPKSIEGCLWPESLTLEQQALLTLLEEDYTLLGRRKFSYFWNVPEGLAQRVFAPTESMFTKNSRPNGKTRTKLNIR